MLSGRRYPDGSRTSLAYDAVGKRTLMADNSGRYTYAYDALGNSTSSKQPYGKSVTYIYDAISRRESLNAPDAGRITYMYDAASQLTAVSNPFSERTTYTYDDAGRRTVQRFSNGTRASFIYNSASNITQLHNRTSAGVTITTFDYKFDSVGNPVSVLEAGGARVSWVYDNDNRLTAERRTGANAFVNTFTYDSTSNRTVKNADAVRTTSLYDVANQLRYSQAVGGRTTFAYDTAGNQQVEQPPTGSRTTTTWDYENQPILYRLPDTSRVTMSYNSDSRRVTKQSASETVKFVWDPGADAYLSELDASNATQALYTQEPQQFGKLISQRRSSISNWYHTDSLGSTRALTNASQVVTDSYLCDAWGNPISSTGTTVNPFRWVGNVGYYFDTATGLFYIRARTYQPSIARWTSVDPLFAMLLLSGMRTRDPIGLRGGPSQYNYVYSSPLMYLDFNGEFGVKPIGQKWEVPDFFAWYYAGLGQDVDIAQVGLLIPWWNHIQPQVYNDLKRSLLPSLESQLDCISGKTSASIDISSKDTLLKEGRVCPGGIHTTAGGSVSDPLTVMGQSCVTFLAICKISIDCVNCCDGSVGISSSKGSCDITFSVRDKFQNPLDVGGFFGKHDWPGSKPYGLNATWYHTWKWSNLYDPCNDDH